jgi:hypothetical protein
MNPLVRYPALSTLLRPFRRSQQKTCAALVAALCQAAQASSFAVAGQLSCLTDVQFGSALTRLYRFLRNERFDNWRFELKSAWAIEIGTDSPDPRSQGLHGPAGTCRHASPHVFSNGRLASDVLEYGHQLPAPLPGARCDHTSHDRERSSLHGPANQEAHRQWSDGGPEDAHHRALP